MCGKMTQKERLLKATEMALAVKSTAANLKFYSSYYDVHFPLRYAQELNDLADNYLKLK